MKNLIWITQLGLSVAIPPLGFTLLAVWIRNRFALGTWVVILGIVIGVICAIDGFRTSLKAMTRMSGEKKQEKPPVSFNDHE